MLQCFDFASDSSSTTNIFAYVQKKNGLNKLHVYTACKGTKEVVFKKNQKDEIILEIFVKELDQRHEIVFEDIKYLTLPDPCVITSANDKPIVLEVNIDIPFMEYPVLPPSNLAELPLTESFLICLRCEKPLADPHPEYFVVLEQAEEIMETAMGCCRCCSSSAESHKCEHIRPPDTGKIFVDDGVILLSEDYLKKDSYIKLKESPLIKCSNCYHKFGTSTDEYFGFQRYPSKHIQILPMQADFIGNDKNLLLKNSYKCLGAYFASQLISTGLESYLMITDSLGNIQFQLGFFFRRLLLLGNAGTKNLRKVTALCFFYTESHTVMKKELNSKIRLPNSALKTFKTYLEQSHRLLKPFTPGLGQWKSAFFCLDCMK